MSIMIGADLVPTKRNFHLFQETNIDELIGAELSSLLHGAEYRIFNLEVPLTDTETPIDKGGHNMAAPSGVAAGFEKLGINLLTLCNNHILDQGYQGLYSTCENLRKSGIDYVDVGENIADAAKPFLVKLKEKTIGIFLFSKQSILIVSGKDFLEATITAKILAGRVLFSSLNAFIVLFLFIPLGRERNNVVSTGIAAIANFLLNMVLIARFAENGAAIATVFAELLELMINIIYLQKEMSVKKLFANIWQYILAGMAIIGMYFLWGYWIKDRMLFMGVMIVVCVPLYFFILLLMKNRYIAGVIDKMKS